MKHGIGRGRGTRIVRGIDVQRSAAAERAMQAAGAELGAALTPNVGGEKIAHLYGLRVVEADDEHGHRHGLVVQHDDVRWDDVRALARLVGPVVAKLDHPQSGCGVEGCLSCPAVRAWARLRSAWQATELGDPTPHDWTWPGPSAR